jgi:hypothetical protein
MAIFSGEIIEADWMSSQSQDHGKLYGTFYWETIMNVSISQLLFSKCTKEQVFYQSACKLMFEK